ncbi:GntR family transcriptional regulator [Asticcacaulis sp. BYS171W]|uniref:GntR family transcriptional regulator n=1 Tax=Asticcacaulis aquaticus TaxID=2984212 RepID=A0ABT5HQ11_9CAUL|nr:GntR family transcriptional regulator [Asticcacaulis aquaticus]MDC7682152.1 GntR family transcriptional regulator [Asticcacaulis aquaticus]
MVGKPLAYEKVYETVKRAVMEGMFWPGQRIEIGRLKALVDTSHIPIREALRRLSAEGLVEAHRREGFSVPLVTEPSLLGHYEWLDAAVRFAANKGTPPPAHILEEIDFEGMRALPIADATSRFFLAVAIASGNTGVEATVRYINDSLHLVRTLKESRLPDSRAELDRLIDTWRRGPLSEFEAALKAYFDLRHALVPEVVRLLSRRKSFD